MDNHDNPENDPAERRHRARLVSTPFPKAQEIGPEGRGAEVFELIGQTASPEKEKRIAGGPKSRDYWLESLVDSWAVDRVIEMIRLGELVAFLEGSENAIDVRKLQFVFLTRK
jgi:hypothetical protein